MKAISIKEPWASLILEGKKRIETRVWKTEYRGPLLLVASKYPKSRLSGKAFAICNLKEIVKMTGEHEEDACCSIYPKAYAWMLEGVTSIPLSPVTGRLNLYEVEVSQCEVCKKPSVEPFDDMCINCSWEQW